MYLQAVTRKLEVYKGTFRTYSSLLLLGDKFMTFLYVKSYYKMSFFRNEAKSTIYGSYVKIGNRWRDQSLHTLAPEGGGLNSINTEVEASSIPLIIEVK